MNTKGSRVDQELGGNATQRLGTRSRVHESTKRTIDKAKYASLHDMGIHEFNKYLLSTYCVPGMVLSALK